MKKVLIGCGVIFLIVALGIGVIGYQGYQWAKNSMPDMEQFTANRAELVKAYGHEDDYAPPLDGNYDPARVGLFVELRETMHPRVVALSSQIDAFHDGRNEGGGIGGFFSQMQAAMGAVGDLMVHAAYTDSLLLANAMGRGEYTHYQLVLTRGWMDLEADVLRWQDDMAASTRRRRGDRGDPRVGGRSRHAGGADPAPSGAEPSRSGGRHDQRRDRGARGLRGGR